MIKNKKQENESCRQEDEHYRDAIIETIISDSALGRFNLAQFNVMICFDLNTVACH